MIRLDQEKVMTFTNNHTAFDFINLFSPIPLTLKKQTIA